LNFFHFDPDFLKNEEAYEAIKKEILGDEPESSSESSEEGGEETKAEDGAVEGEKIEKQEIQDETETDKINLRKTIYLTIMSSLDFEDCAHKLVKIKLKPGQEEELSNMIIECCSQERSYLRFYGLLGQRFCMINPIYQEKFDIAFAKYYATIHRFDSNKIRNIAKLFAHLFHTDSLSWTAFRCIHLNEEETTSSSRIFLRNLFTELGEFMGLAKLNDRFKDPTLAIDFNGIFPKDNPEHTRFAVNFFTAIGLGGVTEDLREWLSKAPKRPLSKKKDSSTSSSSDSDSSDSDSSSSSSSSSSSDHKKKRRKVEKD